MYMSMHMYNMNMYNMYMLTCTCWCFQEMRRVARKGVVQLYICSTQTCATTGTNKAEYLTDV